MYQVHPSNSSIQQNAISHLFKLTEASQKDLALLPEARCVQGRVARADFTTAKASISGTRYLFEKLLIYGYGGLPRKPLLPIDPDWEHPHTQDALILETELTGENQV